MRSLLKPLVFWVATVVLLGAPRAAPAADPKAPVDRRATEVRHKDLPYTFAKPASKDEWLARAAYLHEHVLASNGLLPAPPKGPLNAHIFGRLDKGNYTVEKVYFESLPGHYVTGNLYRPKGGDALPGAKLPAVLNTHGHWNWGRLENAEDASHPVRGMSFARLGYVTFAYDMVGYGDSLALPHKLGGPREELWGLSLMGLQTWNSLRSVDFLLSLPDVDPERIGVTGESGGGTQTFILTAADDRIKAAVPVNMVSAHMQGGCQCENPPNLRVDTFNVEIAALAAPRPQLLISATGDWTKDTLTNELPAVRSVYQLLGAEDKIHAVQFKAVHNNNKDSRQAAYGFFGNAFQDRPDIKAIPEKGGYPPVLSELMVYYGIARPKNELDTAHLTSAWIAMAKRQLDETRPRTDKALQEYRRRFGAALAHALAAEVPKLADVVAGQPTIVKGDGPAAAAEERFFLARRNKGDLVPVTLWTALPGTTKADVPGSFVLVAVPGAAAGQWQHPQRGALVDGLLAAGHRVLGVSLFGGRATAAQPSIKFMNTYNRTDVANRVQDVLTAVSYLRGRSDVRRLVVIGVGKAGLPALLARGLVPKVDALAVDADGFAIDDDDAYIAEVPVPGIRRAGGFVTAAIADTGTPLFIHDTGKKFGTALMADGFRAAGAAARLKVSPARSTDAALVSWVNSLPR